MLFLSVVQIAIAGIVRKHGVAIKDEGASVLVEVAETRSPGSKCGAVEPCYDAADSKIMSALQEEPANIAWCIDGSDGRPRDSEGCLRPDAFEVFSLLESARNVTMCGGEATQAPRSLLQQEHALEQEQGTDLLAHCDWGKFADRYASISGPHSLAKGDTTSSLGDTKPISQDCIEERKYGDGTAKFNRNVVWIYPAHDDNAAFQIQDTMCARLLGWFDMTCSVRLHRVGSVDDAKQVLEQYGNEGIMALVIGGHGAKNAPYLMLGDAPVCGLGALCAWGVKSAAFMQMVKRKMAPHGTIFIDSCSGGANGLVHSIAVAVEKGVQVFGGDNSYSTVSVERFGVGHKIAKLNGSHGAAVVHIQAPGATCPSGSVGPDADGNCECPEGSACKKADQGPCTTVGGGESWAKFDPACATFGHQCACSVAPRRSSAFGN